MLRTEAHDYLILKMRIYGTISLPAKVVLDFGEERYLLEAVLFCTTEYLIVDGSDLNQWTRCLNLAGKIGYQTSTLCIYFPYQDTGVPSRKY